MKTKLRQIYQALSEGRLTQKEALDRIKELHGDKKEGNLLLVPVWQESRNHGSEMNGTTNYQAHHVVLCDMRLIDPHQLEKTMRTVHCVSLKTSPQDNIADRFTDMAKKCFNLVKTVMGSKLTGKVLVQIVVENSLTENNYAGLSGLLKTVSLENPFIDGQIILVNSGITANELGTCLQINKSHGSDKIIKHAGDKRYVLTLNEVKVESTLPRVIFKDHGVYLITGGAGGMGLLFAKEIMKQTNRAKIILTGRSELCSEKKRVLDELSPGHDRVSYEKADVGNFVEVGKLVRHIHDTHHQLNGIIHCAGVSKDDFIIRKSVSDFEKVLYPKVSGTFHLDEATKDMDLDFFVLCSSVASWLGNAGQSDYAAANCFMDNFSAYRNSLVKDKKRWGKTLSVNWPLWEEGGMTIEASTRQILEKATGLHPLQTSDAMQNLYQSLDLKSDQVIAVNGKYKKIRYAFLHDDEQQHTPVVTTKRDPAEDPADFFDKALDLVCRQLSIQLNMPVDKIDVREPLEKYGMDSILSINLTTQLEKIFGPLSKTLFFEYQTIYELTEYFVTVYEDLLMGLLSKKGEVSRPTSNSQVSLVRQDNSRVTHNRLVQRKKSPVPVKEERSANEPIAIVGLSGRYPGSNNLLAYWQNLQDGKDCIIEIPKERWNWRDYYTVDRTREGRHYSKWGGFIDGVDEFDPRFFNISPVEAKLIDPQERLFLQHSWMAIEDAGYTREALQIVEQNDLAGQVGVYVGVMYGEYQLFGQQSKHKGLVNSYASIANRVSYVLNLHGPSLTLDTMCSSSLSAIHLACQDLKQGRTSLAIAGGVNVTIHPNKYFYLSAGQFISGSGHCQSFGEGGDGYVPGEGVGAVVLKRLSEAQRDGNHIYGIIKGSALNHGGKTNGYSVPNPQAQSQVISRALSDAGVNARHISYLEAHGTGTKLGDPIEITALNQAFKKHTADTGFCMIGSVKSNIGHCESAAGIAGLTKVLLQMKHKKIAPSLHATKLNPHIRFEETPFVVNHTLRDWEQPVVDGHKLPRIAGLSSFGAGGANAHIVLQEYEPAEDRNNFLAGPGQDGNFIIPLSARTEEQLKLKARELLDFIRASAPDMRSMAYTLQVGREPMEERLAFVVDSEEALVHKLTAFIEGEQSSDGVFRNQVRRNKEMISVFNTDPDLQQTIDKWMGQGQFSRLMDLWSKGLPVKWDKLYDGFRPNLISLPTYPFAKEHYWVDLAHDTALPGATGRNELGHPLLHLNTSDLLQHSYSSTFHGEEFFFLDYATGAEKKEKALPSVVYMEMARAAVERALPSTGKGERLLALSHCAWGQPFLIAGEKELKISLFNREGNKVDFEIHSTKGNEEVIHFQGQAEFTARRAMPRMDIDALKNEMGVSPMQESEFYSRIGMAGLHYPPVYRCVSSVYAGTGQLLVKMNLSGGVASSEAFTLHPGILEGALQSSVQLFPSSASFLVGMRKMDIFSPCVEEMYAWVRKSKESEPRERDTFDIDLLDAMGNLCVAVAGIQYEAGSLNQGALDEPLTEEKEVVLAHPASLSQYPFNGNDESPWGKTVKNTTKGFIDLNAPDSYAYEKTDVLSTRKKQVTLSNEPFPTNGYQQYNAQIVRLLDHGKGIYSIKITSQENNLLSDQLIDELLNAMHELEKRPSLKALILTGTDHDFLHGGRDEHNHAVERKLYKTIVNFPCPVIAAMGGNASGAGFVVGMLCDFMICSLDGKYAYTSVERQIYPTQIEFQLFKERFTEPRAVDFLCFSDNYTGKQLKEKKWNCPVVPRDEVEKRALALAESLADKAERPLIFLKKHIERKMSGIVDKLTVGNEKFMEEVRGADAVVTSPVEYIKVEVHHNRTIAIRVGDCGRREIKEILEDLSRICSQVNAAPFYRSMILMADHPSFSKKMEVISPHEIWIFRSLISGLEFPVITMLDSTVKNRGWLAFLFSDVCIYDSDGVYTMDGILQSPDLLEMVSTVLLAEFGRAFGNEIVLSGNAYSGKDLQQRNGSMHIAANNSMWDVALRLASSLNKFPRAVWMEWKKCRDANLAFSPEQFADNPSLIEQMEANTPYPEIDTAMDIDLDSDVVKARVYPGGIVEIRMEDRENKNMFSDELVLGLNHAFVHVEKNPSYKVVILTGYDHYFASGGTKETLIDIQKGNIRFTDNKIYQIALACRIPVIAAMQGHGIGAGWTLGMFADITLFSKESKYFSPYMNYGFTPGAGSTLIFPETIGPDLARETLLTAREYSGKEMEERGLSMIFVNRERMREVAIKLAENMAKYPCDSLASFKRAATKNIYDALRETYAREVEMHEETFVNQSEVLKQIQDTFEPSIQTHVPTNSITDSAPAPDHFVSMLGDIKKMLAEELQIEENEIDEDAQFVDIGLDSITGVTLIRKINDRFKTKMDATQIYAYPTLGLLSDHVKVEAGKEARALQPDIQMNNTNGTGVPVKVELKKGTLPFRQKLTSWRTAVADERPSDKKDKMRKAEAIAVVGMAGQFPKSKNPGEFWKNIAEGNNCISEIPRERWDIDTYYRKGEPIPGKTNSKWMGLLDEYDLFDPLFFNISAIEAESMDPQQRVLMQACWHAIEDAGYNPSVLSGSRCGVYIGCTTGDYQLLSKDLQLSAQGFTGGAISIMAARISYFLNLQGPCLSIDTACSSSLVAICSACDSLISGTSDMALAGGVYVMSTPGLYIKSSQVGMLSADGKCHTFDKRANGFVPGEGVGVVMLKRLSDAERDNDTIYGVIKGWGVNQDGKTNGITAPSEDAQTRLEQEVYDKFNIDPNHIQLIEAHGTGTKLGDPIEVNALKSSFKKYTTKTAYCALGSVKSNIGHCLTAAGVASFIKVVQALKHKKLPPTINYEQLNEHISLKESPFYVNTRLREWKVENNGRRHAAISAFGFSGTNAHMVLAEYIPVMVKTPNVPVVRQNGKLVVPLSARTEQQLRQKAMDVVDFIHANPGVNLVEVAYTLQTGREAMGERLGVLVHSTGDLVEKLQAFLNQEKEIFDLYRGQSKRNKEGLQIINTDDDLKKTIIDTWIGQKKLSNLTSLWVKGIDIDWNKLYPENKPHRINMPVYPFAKERYWIEKSWPDDENNNLSVLHPFLHKNVSDFNRQCYRSFFNGQLFFVRDFQIQGKSSLPSFTLVEMVYAAVNHSLPHIQDESLAIELKHVAWNEPIDMDKNVYIVLSDHEDVISYEIFTDEDHHKKNHNEGDVFLYDAPVSEKIDLSQIEDQLRGTVWKSDRLYEFFTEMGMHYGKSYRSLDRVFTDKNQLLSKIILPANHSKSFSDFHLHPSILEGVFQSCIALLLDFNQLEGRVFHPVMLDSLMMLARCKEEMYAWVRYSKRKSDGDKTVKLDIDLCDQFGDICVKIRGLEISSCNEKNRHRSFEESWDGMSYLCRWEPTPKSQNFVARKHKSVLIFCTGFCHNFEKTIVDFYRGCGSKITLFRMSDETRRVSENEWVYDIHNPVDLQACMEEIEEVDAFYFLSMREKKPDAVSLEEIKDNHERNETQLLRIIRLLNQKDKPKQQVDAYLVTLDNYSFNQSRHNWFGAGVRGFAYSLAQSHHRFLVRNIDVCIDDLANGQYHDRLFADMLQMPFSDRGEAIKMQSGISYRQSFLKFIWNTQGNDRIKHKGVYLLAGGSGTVGKIITRNLVERYDAQVIWLGRSAADSEKTRTALHQCGKCVENITYFQSDVTDESSMILVYKEIKKKFTHIHGAIFASMNFSFENSIAATSEEEFNMILEVKTKGAWAFYKMLENENLDFLCYFSSGQTYSFSGASTLSAYAAGITFSDALVRHIASISSFPVGMINWGYWKASLEKMNDLITDNLSLLEDSEGFDCFTRFVGGLTAGEINQILCMKKTPPLEALMNLKEEESCFAAKAQFAPGRLSVQVSQEKGAPLVEAQKQNQFEEWLAKLLFCQINNMIDLSGKPFPETIAELVERCGVADKYVKWFTESLHMLANSGYMRLKEDVISAWKNIDADKIWSGRQIDKERYLQSVDSRSIVALLDDCLSHLPGILSGHTLATDIIFPNSSMEKVEGIYKDNATSDFFNEIVAGSVISYVRQKLAYDSAARLRILEIGAGTGGTTAAILKRLTPFAQAIEEYAYTDISKAFFFHAEEKYVPMHPFVQCRVLDIEKPIAGQGFEPGSYDLVVATNVLHATKNIRTTLRNAKAPLVKNGAIVLNEMSDKSLTTHLTFGLLDGWWLFEDDTLRIPNCPGLYPSTWKRVLEEEGFNAVEFPVQDAHVLGQQIIIAQSDGIIRQEHHLFAKEKSGSLGNKRTLVPENTQVRKEKLLRTTVQKPNIHEYVRHHILEVLVGILKISREEIDPDIAFSDYGMDSILGVNFIKQVNSGLSTSLNTAVIFEYSSVHKLGNHIVDSYKEQIENAINARLSVPNEEKYGPKKHVELRPDKKTFLPLKTRVVPANHTQQAPPMNQDIAVIGLSGMFPKAVNVDEYWRNIIEGVDGVEELPKDYLDKDKYYTTVKQSGKTRCKWGGVVEERACFDSSFFNLSPWEAESMNPHQRLILQEGWKALENAGYNPKSLSGSKTGVYIGAEPNNYTGETFTGSSDAIIASRLSYYLNLKGPAIVVNTGCSSSGVAIHLACDSLRNRETDIAIAGGVNACMDDGVQIRLDEIDMLSPKGCCNTFDAEGSGTIISEGIGIVILKRLDEAIKSKDHIYGVICASGVNQDGASNGITAPNGISQEGLIVDVYKKYDINPEQITYLEAHGTGTVLGDPVEANALVRAFRRFTSKQSYCVVGSAKSHIGHTGAAAAVASLIKVLMSFKHKQIPRLLHFKRLNPLIEFDHSPFFIPKEAMPWNVAGGEPRMAAINSFGHSGTNVHFVVREYEHKPILHAPLEEKVIIPLSAKSEEQLKQKVTDLLTFTEELKGHVAVTGTAFNLVDLAYTLQTGREAMEHRLGFVVSSTDQLIDTMNAFLVGRKNIEGLFTGEVSHKKNNLLEGNSEDVEQRIEQLISMGNYQAVLELWVQGAWVDWYLFYPDNIPSRVCLPSYPFAKEKYWMPSSADKTPFEDIDYTKSDNGKLISVEDILDKLANDLIEEDSATALLKSFL